MSISTETKLKIMESLIKSLNVTDEDLIQDLYLMILETEFNSYESIVSKTKELIDNRNREIEIDIIPLILIKNTKDDISDNLKSIIERKSYLKSVSNAFVDMYIDGYDTILLRKIFEKKYRDGLPSNLISDILKIDISELDSLDQDFLTYLKRYLEP